MADKTPVTFTRPVRVHKKRYPKDARATIEAEIAEELIALGAAIESELAEQGGAKGGSKAGAEGDGKKA